MRGENFLTKPAQYTSVYRQGSSRASDLVIMRMLPNRLAFSRYGISVSHRVGKAVVRNQIKRRLREIMRLTPLQPGRDIVLIARPKAAGVEYARLEKSVKGLLSQAGLLAGEHEESCLRAN